MMNSTDYDDENIFFNICYLSWLGMEAYRAVMENRELAQALSEYGIQVPLKMHPEKKEKTIDYIAFIEEISEHKEALPLLLGISKGMDSYVARFLKRGF